MRTKMLMSIGVFAFFAAVVAFFGFEKNGVIAQQQQFGPAQEGSVNYNGIPAADSDLDGLTDEAELRTYFTDPNNPDTDSDGILDATEVLSYTDPKDPYSYPGAPAANASEQADGVSSSSNETPWAWYVVRSAGLVGFVMLYLSIFLGLTLKIPLLRKIISPVYSLSIHCWISVQALILAFVHGFAMMYDNYLNMKFVELFVPFASHFEPNLVALGVFGIYLMLLLVTTSYGKKYMSHKLWRATHFSNIVLYVIVMLHALFLGTDLKTASLSQELFIWSNAFLVFLFFINIEIRIADAIRIRRIRTQGRKQEENM